MKEKQKVIPEFYGVSHQVALYSQLGEFEVCVIDRNQNIYSCNSEFVRSRGVNLDELNRHHFSVAFSDKLVKLTELQIERLQQNHLMLTSVVGKQMCAGKSQAHYLTYLSPIFDGHHDFSGFISVGRKLSFLDSDRYNSEKFVETLNHMNSHFEFNLSVSDMSEECDMDEQTFRRLIKKLYNRAPASLMVFYRVESAVHMLVRTNFSVAEIAKRAGFYDQAVLSRQFKSMIGITPAQYRQLKYHQHDFGNLIR